jgi:hypothetical protein
MISTSASVASLMKFSTANSRFLSTRLLRCSSIQSKLNEPSPAVPDVQGPPAPLQGNVHRHRTTLDIHYSAFTAPEWYLSVQLPGPTLTGLLHTQETNMMARLYAILLALLASISLAIFPVIANVCRFPLRGGCCLSPLVLHLFGCGTLAVNSWGLCACLYRCFAYWGEGSYGCGEYRDYNWAFSLTNCLVFVSGNEER